MADNNDGGEKAPTRDGPPTGAGPVRMGVYDQPAKQATAASPLTRILPILIALAVLGFLLYRFVLARPATNDTSTNIAPVTSTTDTTSSGSGTSSSTSGTSSGGGGATGSSSGSAGNTTSPPGPRGAASSTGSGSGSGAR